MPSRQTLVEMERGRIIAQRAKRHDDLRRLIAGKKVKVMVVLPGHPDYIPSGSVCRFYVDGVCVGHQNEREDDYPGELLMATIHLAISATVGYAGVPSFEPAHIYWADAMELGYHHVARITATVSKSRGKTK